MMIPIIAKMMSGRIFFATSAIAVPKTAAPAITIFLPCVPGFAGLRTGQMSAEGGLVALNRLLVLALELRGIERAAGAGLMVQLQAQDLVAQFLPIVPCVDQVHVPGLIDCVRRCHGMAGARGQIEEPAILPVHP